MAICYPHGIAKSHKYAYDHGFDAAFPNFNEADTKDGKVYGTWLLKSVATFKDIPAKDLGDPRSLEDRFRAVNKYASDHGFGGAFPNFNEADTREGKVYGTWLFKKDAVEFRDVLAFELGDLKSPEDRFRAVNKYAYDRGFDAAFPTFYESEVYGTWLLKKGVATFRDIPAKDLGDPRSLEDRFRAVNKYSSDHGFGGAFPNFNEANSREGKVYGTWLFKKDAAEFRDVSAFELGDPKSPEDRFRAVNKYASDHGFGGAFPTFYESEVCGTLLLKGVATFRDIPAKDLGNPRSIEDRFRAVNKYASDHGFGGAFPNFNEADSREGKVYGTWLLKNDAAEFRDIPFYSLVKSLIRPGDVIYGQGLNRAHLWPNHVGIIINDGGKLVVREAWPKNKDHANEGVTNIDISNFAEDRANEDWEARRRGRFKEVRIYRHKNDRAARQAAENSKRMSGTYQLNYLEISGTGYWRSDDHEWYCSKLVWKAYADAGIYLKPLTGKGKIEIPVTPNEIADSKELTRIFTYNL